MPRPPRCRRICGKPQIDTFCPNGGGSGTPILLTLDEYEVIRLVDLEQRTHEQCAAQMDISRSTVQEIYESARQKIAACLVHGKPLRITGGNYRICGGEEHPHCGRSCRMRTFNETDHKQKGEPDMKIAVTYENGEEVSREVINNSTYQTSDVTVKVGTKSDNAEATKLVEEAIATQDQEKINAAISKASALK